MVERRKTLGKPDPIGNHVRASQGPMIEHVGTRLK